MMSTCPICQSSVKETDAVCPVCKFRLQDRTQEFAPVSLEPEEASVGFQSQSVVLRMVRGPQVGISYPIEGPQTTLGRNPDSDIFLNDMTVSREHAKITHEGGAYVIRDLKSFNGLWVNNHAVEAQALKDGDFIQIGKFGFIFDEA